MSPSNDSSTANDAIELDIKTSNSDTKNNEQSSNISVLYIVMAFLCLLSGVSSTFQSGINARIGVTLNSGYLSLIFAFLNGTCIVMIARLIEVYCVADPKLGRRPSTFLEGLKCYLYFKETTKWYHFAVAQLPALIGVCFVLVGILITPELGFGLVFVLQIIGGMIASCFIDHFAILGLTKSRFTIIACLGVLIACVGAALTVVAQISDSPPEASTGLIILYAVLTFASGVVFSFQGAINSYLTAIAYPSPLIATLSTYFFGSIYALIVVIIACAIDPKPYYDLHNTFGEMDFWMWFTGLTGMILIGVAVYAIPVVGAGLWYTLMLTGQLASATIVDDYNTFSLGRYEASALRIIGVVIAVLAVCLFKLAHYLTRKFFNGIDPILGPIDQETSSSLDSDIQLDDLNSPSPVKSDIYTENSKENDSTQV